MAVHVNQAVRYQPRERVREVSCPNIFCGATVGQPCLRRNGAERIQSHLERCSEAWRVLGPYYVADPEQVAHVMSNPDILEAVLAFDERKLNGDALVLLQAVRAAVAAQDLQDQVRSV